jgi:aldehyde dehydrogenase (NAD+)
LEDDRMTQIPRSLGIGPVEPGVYSARSWFAGGTEASIRSPRDGAELGRIRFASPQDLERAVQVAVTAFESWRLVPAPARGELVRRIGAQLRDKKVSLAELISLECGKIRAEALGEVQEMIDMADYAVGLSRSVGGLTFPSERPAHRIFEQWHPLGPVGVITAFNFPVAVWAWNAFIAAICGDTVIWKPSEKTPLSAIAVQKIAAEVLEAAGHEGVFSLVAGEAPIGELLAADRRVPLISATGSCRMGRSVARAVAGRLGRQLLELGGNNAVILLADADLDLALRAVLFGALGTAGQRCTTTRRLIVEASIAPEVTRRLIAAFESVRIGDPLDPNTLVGPLIDERACVAFESAIARIQKEGGEVLSGGERLRRPGHFVRPTLVRARADMPIVAEETFAPILYVIEVTGLEEAIHVQNSVPQGLSSAIFTNSVRSSERFLSAAGSDCGIANVNLGTSGAEIGGAFGGEKDTGGGRESGSDSWKAYMRRQTCTINYGTELPLAQGIRFESGSSN